MKGTLIGFKTTRVPFMAFQDGAGTPSRTITGNTRSVFRSEAEAPSETVR